MPNNHEPEFRDRLYDYESPVDPEAIWQAVNAELHPPKKRWRLLWWLPALLILLGGMGFYVWQQGSGAGAKPLNPPITAEVPQVQSNASPEDQQDDPAEASTPKQASVPEAGDLSAAGTAQRDTDDGQQTTVDGQSITDNRNQSTTNRQQVADTRQPSSRNNQPIAANRPTFANNPQPTTKNEQPAILHQQQPIDAPQSVNNGEPVTDAPQRPTPASQLTTINRQQSTALLPWPTILLSSEDLPTAEPIEVIECAFTPAKQSIWTLGSSTSISRIGQTFVQGEGDQSSEDLLQLYQSNVRPLEAISADLMVGYQTRNNWTIRSGLGYTRINSVAEATSVSVNDSLRGEGIVRIDVRAPGDTSFIMGTVALTQTTTRNQTYYNNVTLIDLPILVGRRFTAGKFDLNLEAGPVLNLYARASARLPITASTFSERTDTESLYRSSFGISWRGQASVGYRLTEKLSIHAGVDYRRLPQRGLETNNAPVKTRYNLLGGQIGLRYRF